MVFGENGFPTFVLGEIYSKFSNSDVERDLNRKSDSNKVKERENSISD